MYATPSGKRRDFIIMEVSLLAKCEVSRRVYPPETEGIGGNYVGKCLRSKREKGEEREERMVCAEITHAVMRGQRENCVKAE